MKEKNRIFGVIIGCLFCLCGCGKVQEQIFFHPQAAEATYEQENRERESVDLQKQIVVHVCGAVCEPGVVSLPEGARAVDAIALAGGMTAQADENYVNLAEQLTDGLKLYIPTKEEVSLWEEEKREAALININTAQAEQLCLLPGIGESKAADIIAYREKQGAFACKEDIMKVPGIKSSLYEKIEELIIVE